MDKAITVKQWKTINRDLTRQRYQKGTPEYDVFESFYACAIRVTEVAYYAIDRAFPMDLRRRSTDVRHRYERAFNLAKSYMTRYKTIVRDQVVPLCTYTKHETSYDFNYTDFLLEGKTKTWEDRPTYELRLAIWTQLYWLYEKLVDFGPLMIPEDSVESFKTVLKSTFETEARKLLEALSVWECDPVLTAKDFE